MMRWIRRINVESKKIRAADLTCVGITFKVEEEEVRSSTFLEHFSDVEVQLDIRKFL